MSKSYLQRDDINRNPLTEEQRLETEKAAEEGTLVSVETLQALLYNLDCLRLEICEWQSLARRELQKEYYGPADAADERSWSYLYD